MGKLILVAVVAGALGGGAGFFVHQRWFTEDKAFLEANKQSAKKLDELDAALDTSGPAVCPPCAAAAAPKPEAAAAPKPEAAAATATAPKAEAGAPADWKPKVLDFAIKSTGMSRVSFTSEAPLETIVGTTTDASGTLHLDLGNLSAGSSGTVEVDLASIKTGVELRDEHLRGENWLDTEKHPKASFKLTKLTLPGGGNAQLWPGRKVTATVEGELTIKGTTKALTAEVTASYRPWTEDLARFKLDGDVLRVQTEFKVKLGDFGISAPKLVGSKVAEEVVIALNLTAVSTTR